MHVLRAFVTTNFADSLLVNDNPDKPKRVVTFSFMTKKVSEPKTGETYMGRKMSQKIYLREGNIKRKYNSFSVPRVHTCT